MINSIFQVLLSVIIPGLILVLIEKRINRRGPRLVYYVSAATWFTNLFPEPNTPRKDLHVVTIAIRNNGNEVARNIDISHFRWPLYFQIVPFIPQAVLPDAANPRIIRLTSLNPNETIWISYLFDSLIDTNSFIEYVRSEEMVASRTNMILNPIFPPRLAKFLGILLIFGLVFIGISIWWLYPPITQCVNWIIKFPR
jgi:hypothetical protein